MTPERSTMALTTLLTLCALACASKPEPPAARATVTATADERAGSDTPSDTAAATAAVSAQLPQGDGLAPSGPPATATAALDPAPLDAVLRKHVRNGRVDYRALKADADARAKLDAFLDAAAKMPESAPLASWLNVYNALVIQLVLERYPIGSVMDVPGFFEKLKRTVAGKPRSLDEIEHGVIRKRFADARVHMALNCGAVACPPLLARAFRDADLDQNLDALARAAVADPLHVKRQGGKLRVSALFFWFAEDFERDAGSVLGWIKRYGPPALAGLPDDTELVQREYDWKLADAR